MERKKRIYHIVGLKKKKKQKNFYSFIDKAAPKT